MRSVLLLLASSIVALGQPFSFNDQAFLAQGGGETLLNSIVAAWHFDEPTQTAVRYDSVSHIGLYDTNSNNGSARGVIYGALSVTNGAGPMGVADSTPFNAGSGKSFTLVVWQLGNGNSSGGWLGEKNDNLVGSGDYYITGSDGTGPAIEFADLSGTQHSMRPTLNGVNWHMWVMDYNSASQTMTWGIDNNLSTLSSISGVRSSGLPFQIHDWLAWLDELMFWNRSLTTAELTQLYNNGFGLAYPFTTTDRGVLGESGYGWAVTNAGSTVSATTSNSIASLIRNMDSQGIWTKMVGILAYPTDSLTTAFTPVKTGYAVSGGGAFTYATLIPSAGNHNFTDSDLSVNGIKGDGSTKYIDLYANGTIANHAGNMFPTPNDASFTLYCNTAGPGDASGDGAHTESGFYYTGVSPNPLVFLRVNDRSEANISVACIGDLALGRVNTNTPEPGYYTVNRPSASEEDLYIASSQIPHGLYSKDTTPISITSFPGVGIYLWALNANGSTVEYSTNTVSFYSYGTHLTLNDSSNYFADIESYMIAKGGGFASPFTTQPTNSVVLLSNNKSLVGVAAGATAYQWQKNGVNIAGATSSSYTVTGAALSDFGTYTLDATVNGMNYPSAPVQFATVTTTTVSNWVVQCAVNGAALLSSNTIWGVDQFWNGLVTDGLDGKPVAMNCFVPDSLTAALTPLVATAGNKLWVNHSFVASDLTVNGLKGDTSARYLDTGMNCSSAITVNNSGITVYDYSIGSTTGGDVLTCGAQDTVPHAFNLYVDDTLNNNVIHDSYSYLAGGRLVTTSPAIGAYYSGNRTSSSAAAIYYANSTHAHSTLVTLNTVLSSPPSLNMFVFALNNNGSPYGFSDERISFIEFGLGLSSGDSSNFYNRVQALRTTLGGGFR